MNSIAIIPPQVFATLGHTAGEALIKSTIVLALAAVVVGSYNDNLPPGDSEFGRWDWGRPFSSPCFLCSCRNSPFRFCRAIQRGSQST